MKPYYSEPNITIYNGDCLEVMKELEDESIDCIIADPPYGINYSRHITNKRFDFIQNDNCLDWLGLCIQGLHRILLNNNNLYMFCSWHNVDYFKQSIGKLFHIKNMLVWDKGGGGMGDLRTDYGNVYELIMFACKYPNNQKALNGKRDNNILNFNRSGNKNHPTEKPVELIKYLINKSTNKNDLILDPFLGSGTTARACKDLGRKCIGIEISKEYCDIAVQRLAQEVLSV